MDARRGGRPPQVRPRPSPHGPTRGRIRPAQPSTARLLRHRTVGRRQRLPLAASVALGGGILVLGWICVMIALGVVGPAASSMAKGLGDLAGSLANFAGSPTPSVAGTVSGAPVIEPPGSPITNVASVDLTVQVPAAVVGQTGFTCRLYVALPKAAPAIVTEAPVGGTATLVFSSVALAKGANTFTATIAGPSGESAPSAGVVVTLDVSKPPISITTPKNGASVTGTSVAVKGKTQAGSSVRVQDDANGATANTTADDTGLFSTSIAVAAGPNNLTVTVTDPAGNSNTATISVALGTGTLRVKLVGTVYQFDSKRLPTSVTFTATVVGADGSRVAGASALFTVSVPGLQPVVSAPIITDQRGVASFTTSIPKGAMAGSGLTTVLITLPTGSQTATDRAVLTVR